MGRGKRELHKGSCEQEQNLWAGPSTLRGGALWSWRGDCTLSTRPSGLSSVALAMVFTCSV